MNELTIMFNDVFIKSCSAITGPKEKEGPLKRYFDYSFSSERADEKSFEAGEKKMIEKSIEITLKKAKIAIDKIDLLMGGDLTNQLAISNQIAKDIPLSFIGVYSACSTLILAMGLSSIFVTNNYCHNALCFSSSNFGTSERQFRYPLEYGVFKKATTTITVTGASSCIISKERSRIRINGVTFGKVHDVEWSDASDMGSPMAFAAFQTIKNHLKNTSTNVEDYDLILTGDLSNLGSKVLEELFLKDNVYLKNHLDAGNLIYKREDKTKFMGGSGSSCIGLVTFSYILKQMIEGRYQKVLLVGTGALHSATSVQQKQVIPIIAHALEIEVIQ